MIAIIVDDKDLAGLNIRKNLIDNFHFDDSGEKFDSYHVYRKGEISIYTSRTETIHCEDIDKKIPSEMIIFATKHRSSAEVKTLSVHTPGNWSKNELGGQEKKTCISPVHFIKTALKNLAIFAENSGYEVSLEVTHHGPYIESIPCCFIEIGSTEKQWTDEKPGLIIAQTIIKSINEYKESMIYKTAIGLGGGHYAPYFNKINLSKEYAIGHMAPKYALEAIDEKMLRYAMDRNFPKAEIVIIDEKGMGEHKQRIIKIMEENNIRFEKCRKINR